MIEFNAQKILDNELSSIVTDLKKKHLELGMKASGRWTNGLEVIATPREGKIIGEHYTEYLEKGRGPTRTSTPSSPTLKEAIEIWIRAKGIQPRDISISSLAFVIARKIHEEGTRYFKQGGTDLISAVITPARTQQIIDRIGLAMMAQLIPEIQEQIKKSAQ